MSALDHRGFSRKQVFFGPSRACNQATGYAGGHDYLASDGCPNNRQRSAETRENLVILLLLLLSAAFRAAVLCRLYV